LLGAFIAVTGIVASAMATRKYLRWRADD